MRKLLLILAAVAVIAPSLAQARVIHRHHHRHHHHHHRHYRHHVRPM
ncbi:MAG TPA: hypothetical protein VGV37_07385 [Aliidongia sp.]|nr:hypothetical protein [Aliidongia sp.]HEV2674349.1 hypothetical protein [Aliidongia sp.]